jgi:glycosyltransferase involved in cell wall biosynthesis
MGARVVFVCHNALPHESFPFARALGRLALDEATSLIALSTGVATELRALIPRSTVEVVPHPAYDVLAPDPTTFDERVAHWRERLQLGETKVILFFGNVRPYKGVSDLVDAFAQMRARTGTTLVVAGTFFEPLESYERQIESLGLTSCVRLIPEYVPNEEVAALFSLADLVVLPYRSASQSGVIPIAAMLRKPVVATSVGGLAEALDGSGSLVPPNDPAALAAAIDEALDWPPSPPPDAPDAWGEWRAAIMGPALP